MHLVKKKISGMAVNVGDIVDASAWPNVGALRRAGYLDVAPAEPSPDTIPQPVKRRKQKQD